MCTYISITDGAECMRRWGQGVKGSGYGLGWDRASSGWTELRVDATGGAQDGVGCHSHDSIPFLGPSPRGRGCKCRVQSVEANMQCLEAKRSRMWAEWCGWPKGVSRVCKRWAWGDQKKSEAWKCNFDRTEVWNVKWTEFWRCLDRCKVSGWFSNR